MDQGPLGPPQQGLLGCLATMPTARAQHIAREHAEAEERRPAAPTLAIELEPGALTRALERRISM